MARLPKVRLRALVPFPTNVSGSTGINLTKTNGIWTITLDVSDFHISNVPVDQTATTYAIAFGGVTDGNPQGSYSLVPFAGFQGSSSDLTSLAELATFGIVARIGDADFTTRTATGTANRITVTNGNGVAGNPTWDISTSYVGQATITTLGTIATGTWNATAIGASKGGFGADISASSGVPLFVTGTATFTSTTGSGNFVRATSASLVTPALGTPTAIVLTNGTGMPTTGLTGTLQAAQEPAHTGDVTNSAGSLAMTLATVNANVGTFGSATQSVQFTVNGKGLTTAAANVTITPAVGSITGLGTSVATALAVGVGTPGSFAVVGGALGTPASGVATNLSGTAAALTAGNVTTNANLTGDVTSVGNATTLTNAPVIAKVLTGYVSGAGTISATDSILSAIQKLNGNNATNANLTGDVTSVGNATTLAAGSAGNLNSGTLLAARMPAHTGDVTSSAGSIALTLAAGSAGVLNSGTLLAARMPALTGDITTSAGAVATTLATVNTNVGTFGSATQASQVTVNGKGLVTAAANVTVTPAVGSITGLGTGVGTFLVTPSSANLASALTDETGSSGGGVAVFSNAPALTSPTVTTQSAGDNSTKAASTAFVQTVNSAAQLGVFSVHKNGTAQTGLSTGDVQITFGTEAVDAANAFASNAYTAPSDGHYHFNLEALLIEDGWSDGGYVFLKKNGTKIREGNRLILSSNFITQFTSTLNTKEQAAAGDVFTAWYAVPNSTNMQIYGVVANTFWHGQKVAGL